MPNLFVTLHNPDHYTVGVVMQMLYVILYSGPNDCYEGNGESYRGFVSETVEGMECLPWNYYLIPFKDFEGNDSIGAHTYCR